MVDNTDGDCDGDNSDNDDSDDGINDSNCNDTVMVMIMLCRGIWNLCNLNTFAFWQHY